MAILDRAPQFLKNVFPGYFARKLQTPKRKNIYGLPDSGDLSVGDDKSKWYQGQTELGQDRAARYTEYEAMDTESVEIATALDHYADDATQMDYDHGATVWVESEIPAIKALLDELLHERLHIEDYIWGLARSLAKYGDVFRKIVIDFNEMSKGIIHWIPEHPKRMIRDENPKTGQLKGFRYSSVFLSNSNGSAIITDTQAAPNKEFKPWDFVHFRILGDMDPKEWNLLYGQSMLKAVRPTWKRLKLLEEALGVYRLMKGPDRTVYYVDTGDMSPEEAWQVVRQWKRTFKRNSFLDKSGQGQFSQAINPAAFDEEIIWPIAKDNASRIDKLPGGADVNSIVDLDYFKQKLQLGLKIPIEYMSGQAGAIYQFGPGSLATKDIKYAKAIKRLQRALIQGLTLICEIHLAWLDIDPSDRRFSIKMATISGSDEEQRLNNMSTRIAVAAAFADLAQKMEVSPDVIKDYVVRRILGLDGEIALRFLTMVAPPPPAEPPVGGQELPKEDTTKVGVTKQAKKNSEKAEDEEQDAETNAQTAQQVPVEVAPADQVPQEGIDLMQLIQSDASARDKIQSLVETIEALNISGEKHERIYGRGAKTPIPNPKEYANMPSEELNAIIEFMESTYKASNLES